MKSGATFRCIAFSAAALLGACSQGVDNTRIRVDVIEEPPRPFAIGAMPLPLSSAYLRSATAQGLVTFDMTGRIVPALANRWIVTDDGLSYIFRLNEARWNDNREVTSAEVARLLNARFGELRKARFAPELAVIDRAVSMTGKVVEIRLKAPMPYLLEMIAQPEFGLVRQGFGAGPMTAKRLEQAMQLRRKEAGGGTALQANSVTLRSSKASLALARFGAGENDLISGGRFEHLPLLEAAKIDGNAIKFDPVAGIFGLLFVEAGPFFADRANREAIAMAIDRPRILTSFDIVAWQETVSLVPENLPSRTPNPRPAWSTQRVDERKGAARETISRWINGSGPVRAIRIALPQGPGARIFFARLQADLAAIGLNAERVTVDKPHDLRLIDRVGDQSSPAWYLDQMSCDMTRICSADADDLVAQARMATDITARATLLSQAEIELQSTRNFIPIANPLRWSVTRKGLLGHDANGRGWHLLQNLGRGPT